jgi:beta-lactam-binding protein with PASTA domain
MARSVFTITAPSDTARIDYQNHGQIVFTVTNVGGHPLRGRAKVVTQDPNQSAWLKIGGEAERDFAVNGTQQYTVTIDAKNGKPGKYSFRFDVVSVELPDEEYTQGPTTSFTVLEPPEKQKPSFPLWLIPVLAIIVLAVVGTGVWLFMRSSPTAEPTATATPTATAAAQVRVPNVGGGMALEEAQKQIRDLGLVPTTQEVPSQEFQPGQVIRSEPAVSAMVSPGAAVKLIVVGKTTTVPGNVVGMTSTAAANAVGGVHLISQFVGDGTAPQLDPQSQVSAASPAPGTLVLEGSTVQLTIKGPRRRFSIEELMSGTRIFEHTRRLHELPNH